MNLLEITKPDIDPDRLALAINRGRPDETLRQCVQENLPQAKELVTPQAVYELWTVVETGPDWVRVEAGDGSSAALTVGPHADLLSPAQMVMASAATIGQALDDAVKRLNQQKDLYSAYVLDCLGVAFLAEAGRAVDSLAEQEAAQRGWGVGPRLAPGSLPGWELSDQKVLAQLLLRDPGPVSLTQEGVLRPFKSATSLIGMGPGYTSGRVGRICHMCSRSDDCWSNEKIVTGE
ncbi:MAG: hypothetical protein KQI62_14660 [Deltaproteobacteria bacterium]|nr:hypothetical protein [Deltaproteobacteria bacterium]